MKITDLQVPMKLFYQAGIVLFLVIAIANSIHLSAVWSGLTLPSKISSVAGIIFNIFLILFFNWLRKNAIPQTNNKNMPSPEEIKSFMDELK